MAKKKSKKKSLGAGFYVSLAVLIVLPVVSLIGWYLVTVTESERAAEDLLAQAQEATNELIERGIAEGFSIADYDKCQEMESHFKTALNFDFNDDARRRLIGLPTDASDDDMQERCVVFAKVVAKMEKLTHHDRHVFVCQGANFSADNDAYKLFPDADGQGVVEIDTGVETFIPIKPHRFILKEIWQVYNVGDGCLVVGMSRKGNFSYTGTVKVTE